MFTSLTLCAATTSRYSGFIRLIDDIVESMILMTPYHVYGLTQRSKVELKSNQIRKFDGKFSQFILLKKITKLKIIVKNNFCATSGDKEIEQ